MSATILPFVLSTGPSYRPGQSLGSLCQTDLSLLLTLRYWFAAQLPVVKIHTDWRTPLTALGLSSQTCAICASLLALVQLYSGNKLHIHTDSKSDLSADEALYMQMLWELQQENGAKAAKQFTDKLHPLIRHMALKSAWDLVHALNAAKAKLMQRSEPACIVSMPQRVGGGIAL